jgi:hypothetical protein
VRELRTMVIDQKADAGTQFRQAFRMAERVHDVVDRVVGFADRGTVKSRA